MKILWFTNTPSLATDEFKYSGFGGGWIASLEALVRADQKHDLGICFFYDGPTYRKVVKENVVYHGIPYEQENFTGRILNRHKGISNDNSSEYIDTVLQDFKPDVIHVFGTELGYGKLLANKAEKVVFHIQGMLTACCESYFPKGVDKRSIYKNSSFQDIFRGITFYHRFLQSTKKAERELEIIRQWKYFSGRTDYDRNYTKLINPKITYFHCEELLRPEFFAAQWEPLPQPARGETIVIGTTINPNMFKGLDVIYKVAALLRDYNICWKIFGLTEDRDLNRMIRKIYRINQPEPALQFCGPVHAPKLIAELKTCHFFVHPSYIDNSPNSVCEAMLLGMPVLSSAVGGINSLITHKVDGFLFNPYDKYEVAALLLHLVNNYDEALEAGKKARVRAMTRHSASGILNALNDMYNSIYHAHQHEAIPA